ncbi:MAG: N-acyl homoserine lactonase family protein [bacterium]|nr:N-acyl homoserine lactonase family protein [bacterium]
MADRRVHILFGGGIGMDKDWVSGTLETRATRQNRNLPATWYPAPVVSALVEDANGTILFDTGAPRDWEERWGPVGLADVAPYEFVEEDQYLDSRLEQLGVAPADVDIVVLSHLHFDHAANASMFAGGDTRVLVHTDELAAGLAFEGDFAYGNLKADYEHLDMETVEGDLDLIPGVRILEVPGHTPGTIAMAVDMANDRNLLFASDAIFMQENIGPPHSCGLSVGDHGLWAQSVDKLIDYSERNDALIVFGHDADQIPDLKLAPDAFYT